MIYSTGRNRRLEELSARLEASADRICDLQDAILKNIGTMPPAELDRLLDALRAEQVRYDNIDRELVRLEAPRMAEKNKEKQRRRAKTAREKIKY